MLWIRFVFVALVLPHFLSGAVADGKILGKLLSSDEAVDLTGDGKPDRFNVRGPEGTVIVRKTDLNGDGRIDIIDYFDNRGELYKRELSSAQNGKIDTWISFEPSGRVFKEYDRNQDGKIDKTEESLPKGDRIFIRIRTGLDKAPALVKESVLNVPAMQPADEKESEAHVMERAGRAVEALKAGVDGEGELKPLQPKKKNGMWETSYGFQIEDRCLKFFGEKDQRVNGLLFRALAEGVACLWELGGEVKTAPNRPRFHVAEFGSLLLDKENPPKLYCEVGDERMKGLEARASSAQLPLDDQHKHPSIILNMDAFAGGTGVGRTPLFNASETYLKRTLFHELFHNIGQVHGKGIEFAYACSHHCFPDLEEGKEPNEFQREIASRSKAICKGEYPKEDADPKYLEDISGLFVQLGQYEFLAKALMGALLSHPDEALPKLLLAESNTLPFNSPFGAAWAEMVDTSKLKKDEKARLREAMKTAQGYTAVPAIKMFYDGAGRPLARSLNALAKKDHNRAFRELASVKYPAAAEFPEEMKQHHAGFVAALRGYRWQIAETLEAQNVFRLQDLDRALAEATSRGDTAAMEKAKEEIAVRTKQQEQLKGELRVIANEGKR